MHQYTSIHYTVKSLNKPKTCQNEILLKTLHISLRYFNLVKVNTYLNQTKSIVQMGFGLERFYTILNCIIFLNDFFAYGNSSFCSFKICSKKFSKYIDKYNLFGLPLARFSSQNCLASNILIESLRVLYRK